ncbi:MAG: CYTH domain-containing protein [Porphyrobacter sp.]|nr:CYTH domain-containing protein [Porphyrobacter sp.]
MTTTAPSRSRDQSTTFAGMDAIEIKVTVRPDQELRAERTAELDEDSAEIRVIYYYDTPGLDLFKSGLALRARLVKGDDDDSTVKFRPVDGTKVPPEWRELEGFKVEGDWVGDGAIGSASLTHPQQRDEIDEVAKGTRPIEKLFSKDQERFLKAFYKEPFDFGQLRVMGPIRVLRWKLRHKSFRHDLTVEEWRLPDGDDLVELSIKVAPEEAAAAREAFNANLEELGLDPKGAQQTKTRTALEYFAKALKAK